MDHYLDESVAGFADLVARPEPAPAAGSVTAATVVLAAALATKAARLSTRQLAEAERVAAELDQLRARAAALADDDARAYAAVLAAIRESGRTGDAARGAWRDAARVPLTIVEVGARVAELAARISRDGNPNLRGDALTALQLATATVESAAELVAINVVQAGLDPAMSDRATALAERVAALA